MNMEHRERKEWVQEIINQLAVNNGQMGYGASKTISQSEHYFR
nr:hypothetical protein [Anabaena sp. CA = ATCC 33047]